MYNVKVVGDKYNAWVHYGDVFPFNVALYDDDAGTIPSDLTGMNFVMGLETQNGTSIYEIDGVVSANEVAFDVNPTDYMPLIKEGEKIKFDYWETTTKNTGVDKSDLEFKKVAHITEV